MILCSYITWLGGSFNVTSSGAPKWSFARYYLRGGVGYLAKIFFNNWGYQNTWNHLLIASRVFFLFWLRKRPMMPSAHIAHKIGFFFLYVNSIIPVILGLRHSTSGGPIWGKYPCAFKELVSDVYGKVAKNWVKQITAVQKALVAPPPS